MTAVSSVRGWHNGGMDSTLTDPLLRGPFTRVLIELRWGDLDAYGHINNVAQFRILEEARVRAFGSPTANRDAAAPAAPGVSGVILGPGIPPVFGDASGDTDILVFSHRIEYRESIPYRTGPIAVDTVISAVGPATVDVGYVIAEPDGSRAYTVAESVIAMVDADTGRARRLTESETVQLRAVVGDRVPLRRR